MDAKIGSSLLDWQKIKDAAYLPFLALFIVSGLVCIGALRHNNQTMISLRDEVYAADKNNGDVNVALNKLSTYVFGHMNTNLSTGTSVKPPIQLQYTYERLVSEAQKKSSNEGLYIEAKNYCELKIPASVSFYGTGRISCVQNYILSHGGTSTLPKIPNGLYEFDFASPSWSPDLAGWSLVLTIISAVGLIISIIWKRFKPLSIS